eukprot:scaffold263_cov51-Phaeocystis_antarctica.AAC.1
MSHWPWLGRGQAPCSCSRHSTLKNVAIPTHAIPVLVEGMRGGAECRGRMPANRTTIKPDGGCIKHAEKMSNNR